MATKRAKPSGLVIVGPTGVGKTALSLAIAEKTGAEVVSADSRQVYRYLDIGASKPSAQERSRVVHHMIDVVDPDQEYNAGVYGRQAREAVSEIVKRDRIPLVVGGSGLYLSALLHGFFELEVGDGEVREALKLRAAREGSRSLFDELERADPVAAQRLHPNDAQRIVRALEVYLITGRSLSEWQQSSSPPFDLKPLILGLAMPRPLLHERIEKRVDRMMADGLVGEAEGLLARGYRPELNALQTVGYKEVFGYLKGERTLAEATHLIKRNTRRYAKRQMTWFRRDPDIHWLQCDRYSPEELVSRCMELLSGRAQHHGGSSGKFPIDRSV